MSISLSVCLSVRTCERKAGRISFKINITEFLENLYRNLRLHWNGTETSGALLEDVSTFNFCRRNKFALNHSCAILSVLYCWQWLVAQQFSDKTLLLANRYTCYANLSQSYVYMYCLSCFFVWSVMQMKNISLRVSAVVINKYLQNMQLDVCGSDCGLF
jgi:hypothetical protein